MMCKRNSPHVKASTGCVIETPKNNNFKKVSMVCLNIASKKKKKPARDVLEKLPRLKKSEKKLT